MSGVPAISTSPESADRPGALLRVRGLSVRYRVGDDAVARAVDDVSFDVPRDRTVGLVGESGCGKTTVAKTLLRLLPPNADVVAGDMVLEDRDLLALGAEEFRRLRWTRLSYIPQNALSALNPVFKVGDQMAEPMRVHRGVSKKEAARTVANALAKVGLDGTVASAYPHQLSGGMRQRVLIAMALVLEPVLVVVDEPTTALDVLTQLEVLKEFKRVREQSSTSFLYVSHDLGVVKEVCDDVLVMYAGKLVERGPADRVFSGPAHPFTMGLLYAVPESRGAAQMVSIPGATPDLRHAPRGCPFAERCPFATELCLEEMPALRPIGDGQEAACHYVEQSPDFREDASRAETWGRVADRLQSARAREAGNAT